MFDTISEKPRALVADDDRIVANLIRLVLTRAGFDVTVAGDGRVALQLALTTHFQVVTSDYQMPFINGEQLLRAIRTSGASRRAALILCSAKTYELNIQLLRSELNLSAVLYKPLSLAELSRVALDALADAESRCQQ